MVKLQEIQSQHNVLFEIAERYARGLEMIQRRCANSPLPLPSSIKLLARRPLMPELLRLFESALALRISLFRLMIGVSAKGSAIFVVLSSSGACAGPVSGAGVWF